MRIRCFRHLFALLLLTLLPAAPGFADNALTWSGELSDKPDSQVVLPLEQASNRFEFPIPRKPERLVFNPHHEVLAQVLEKE